MHIGRHANRGPFLFRQHECPQLKSVSVRRACRECHLHCRHVLAFFAGGWRVRAELDRFGVGTFVLAFLGVASEQVLLKRPDDSSSAATCFVVSWTTLRFTAFRFIITSSLEFVFGPSTVQVSLASGLCPRLRRFVANCLLASADRASYSDFVK